MSDWLNMVTINVARNGTTSHTVTPSSTGTVVAGAAFTPTAGRLLLCIVEGAVTSTTPSGWTLPTNGSAINNTGLYLFTKTAAGGDSITTTHNGSNYPIVVTFIEFPAGSTFVKAAAATSVALAGANPTLSALTGTNWLGAAKATGLSSGLTYSASTWSGSPTPAPIVDTGVAYATTDGYGFTIAEANASTASSWAPTATMAGSGLINAEALTFAVNVAAGGSGSYPVSGVAAANSAAAGTVAARRSTNAVAAAVTAASALVGALLGVNGSASAVGASAGQVAASLPVSGSAACASGASAVVSGLAAVAGAAAGVSASAGDVSVIQGNALAVSGSVVVVADAVGQVAVRRSVAGAAATVSATAGQVFASLPVAGVGGAVSSASADVSVVAGDAHTVSGVVQLVSGSAGSVRIRAAASGAVVASSDSVGAFAARRSVSGSVSAVSAAAGEITNPSGYRDITVTVLGPTRNPFSFDVLARSSMEAGAPTRNPIQVSGATR